MTCPRRGDAKRDRLPHEYLWSEREVRTLRSLWPDVGVIAERLGRSRKAVREKAALIGLPRQFKRTAPWSRAQIAAVVNSDDPVKVVAVQLGRSAKAVKVMRSKLRKRGFRLVPLPAYDLEIRA